jgi:hypothetical protein
MRHLTQVIVWAATVAGVIFFGCKLAAPKPTASTGDGAPAAAGAAITAGTAKSAPRVVCLATNLNVREKPGASTKIVGVMKRGEEAVVPDEDPDWFPERTGGELVDGFGWFEVRLAGGARGYVAAPFVAPAAEYADVAAIDAAARSGDAAVLKTAIAVLAKKAEARKGELNKVSYKISPDGRKYLVSYPSAMAPWRPMYLITLGSGVNGRIVGNDAEWSPDGACLVATWGDCALKDISVFESPGFKCILKCSLWRGNWEFIPETNAMVWIDKLQYHPEPYEFPGGKRVDPATLPSFGREAHPCVYVYDFAAKTRCLAAGPDPSTIRKKEPESSMEYLKLYPTAEFAAQPLFASVAATKAYKEWVGPEVYAYCSEE